jgi:hypothetical protein
VARRSISRLRGPASPFVAAGLAAGIVVSSAIGSVWVFRGSAHGTPGESIWRLLLTDRATVGFIRSAVIMVALYVVASVAALAASGRWINKVKTTGIEADAAQDADATITRLREQLRLAERERDESNRLLWSLLHG